ncbi:hypothetical protein [Alistipes ihumii]|uniref:hypothetical protein n=1 Tax=Alistipes ihumii TaxID=1470347 RepID=UPI002355A9FD|nr:hypothetical protein [Alistipes ihumii]
MKMKLIVMYKGNYFFGIATIRRRPYRITASVLRIPAESTGPPNDDPKKIRQKDERF